MKSGIYQLTIGPYTYVGKSVDIPQRWEQHYAKLNKGTAAKNMQLAYDQYGTVHTKVLLEAHPDLLDEYEGYYINTLEPDLNTAIPCARTDYSMLEWWARNGEQRYPVTYAFSLVYKLEAKNEELALEAKEAKEELAEVQGRWDDKVHLQACTNKLFNRLLVELTELRGFKDHVNNLGWFGRLMKDW
jgi:hypothetical protein